MSRRWPLFRSLGCAALPLIALVTAPLAAQTRGQEPNGLDEEQVRAEYASVLLQAGRYDEAVEAYRELLARDPSSRVYRLGLAQALAWGKRPREAEPYAAGLARERPNDTSVTNLLRAVRQSYEPTAAEALGWVREDPASLPYRLALARAYMRADEPQRAWAHYDTLLMRDYSLELLREAAGAHASAGDAAGSMALLRRALIRTPGDSALRRSFAEALAWSGDRQAAIFEYGALLERHPRDPGYLFARGQLRVWQGDFRAGIADLEAATAIRPGAETYALLGDANRCLGRYPEAREAYRLALAIRPVDTAIAASLRQLDIEERSALTAVAASRATGLMSLSTFAEDNAGFLYLATALGYGWPLGRTTRAGVSFEQRRVSQRFSGEDERYLYGFAVEGDISHTFRHVAVGGRLGVARHAIVRDMALAGVTVSTLLGDARLTLEGATGPAYLPLMTTQALVQMRGPELVSTRPLTMRSAEASLSLPVGGAELWVGAERFWLSDGNERTSVQASVRYPISPSLSALYSGGVLGYSETSEIYWDPERYTAHALGVEYLVRADRLSLAGRIMPGFARGSEPTIVGRDSMLVVHSGTVLHMSIGGEGAYRARGWEIAAGGGYLRGRLGGYQSFNGTLRVRVDW